MREVILRTFDDSVVASCLAMFYAVVSWSSSITAAERKRLDRLVKIAGFVLGCSIDPVEVVGDRRMVTKLSSILDNVSHPLHKTVIGLESSISGRLRHLRCITERHRRSIPPRCYQTLQPLLGDQHHQEQYMCNICSIHPRNLLIMFNIIPLLHSATIL